MYKVENIYLSIFNWCDSLSFPFKPIHYVYSNGSNKWNKLGFKGMNITYTVFMTYH